MNLALALAGVDATLFDAARMTASAAALATAISSAAGVPAAAVFIRRVRDVSNPAAPVVLYINPQYAGDDFPARRRRLQQRRLAGAASVAVDAQILQANNNDAATLSAKLAGGTTFASVVQGALASSPLAGAQVAASVQPYPGAGGGIPTAGGTASVSLTAGAAAGAVFVLISCAVFLYRAKRHRDAAVAPEAAPKAASTAAPAAAPATQAPQLPAAVDGQDWRTFNRVFLTAADMDFLVALGALDADGKRVGARRATAEARARFSTIVVEKLIAFGVLL